MKVVRELIKDVCGQAPYEKRMIELLRIQKDKRALKFAKRRVCQSSMVQKHCHCLEGLVAYDICQSERNITPLKH